MASFVMQREDTEKLVRLAFLSLSVCLFSTISQVIQGAVSYDDGSTWQGFRELYRDPIMDQGYDGDHGAAYPTGKEMENGNVIVSTGQVKSLINVPACSLYHPSRHPLSFEGTLSSDRFCL